MYSKANYTIVGIFVLLFGIGMVWFAIWLGKYGAYREFDTYRIEMTESVSGLSKDSVVKFHGVDIGRVSEIRINPQDIEKIEIFVKIKHGVPIKEDMVASVQMMGVTGLMSIEIEGGTNEAKTLQPTEDFIPTIPTAPSWISVAKKGIGNLSEKITTLLAQGEKLLTDKNIDTFSSILTHVEKMTVKGETLETKTIGLIEEFNQTVVSFRHTMAELNSTFAHLTVGTLDQLQQSNRTLAQFKESVDPVIKKLTTTIKNFNRVTLRVERTVRRGDYNFKKIFEPLLIDMEIMSNQINRLMQQLERSPNDLIFKSRKTRKGPGE